MERNENGLFDYSISCRDNESLNGRSRNNGFMNGASQNNGRMNESMRGKCNMGDNTELLPETDMNCSEEQLAMVYSPYQCFRMLYSPDKALLRGTMFEELDKPLEDCVNG